MMDSSRTIPFELAGPYVRSRRELAKARKIIDRMTAEPDERRRLWRLLIDAVSAES